MTQQPIEHAPDETVVDSYPTRAEAWGQAHVFAGMLRDRGLAKDMGVTVKQVEGAFWIVLVKRGR
jgi:hypothetical protein